MFNIRFLDTDFMKCIMSLIDFCLLFLYTKIIWLKLFCRYSMDFFGRDDWSPRSASSSSPPGTPSSSLSFASYMENDDFEDTNIYSPVCSGTESNESDEGKLFVVGFICTILHDYINLVIRTKRLKAEF